MEEGSVMDVLAGQEHSELTADERAFLELAKQYRIRADSVYKDHEYTLERNGIGFGPNGNVMAIAAEKKAGKTWFGMAMCAAMLKGEFLGMKTRVENAKVIFFDTEQDAVDGQKIQKRVHFLCGWPFEEDNDRFQIFHLREIAPENRRDFVCRCIRYYKPDMCIVDGIRDLLKDFNDLTQSAEVIQDFMTISSECNTAIWTVLHVNPNSEKMRGHLGTELGNKVADILFLSKHGKDDEVVYKMEETDSRGHKDIHSLTFRIDDGMPYGIPVLCDEKEVANIEQSRKEELRAIMMKYIPTNASWSSSKLRDAMKAGENIGSSKAWKMIQEAKACGVLKEELNKLRVAPVEKDEKSDDEKLPF